MFQPHCHELMEGLSLNHTAGLMEMDFGKPVVCSEGLIQIACHSGGLYYVNVYLSLEFVKKN